MSLLGKSMNDTETMESPSSFSTGMRAIATFAITAAAVTLGVLLSRPAVLSQAYFWHNTLDTPTRLRLLASPFAAAAIAGSIAAFVWWLCARQGWNLTGQLWRLSLVLSPVAPVALAPVFVSWAVWQDHDVPFLLLVLLEILAFKATLSAAIDARPRELLLSSFARDTGKSPIPVIRTLKWPRYGWLTVVGIASIYYTVWFSYYTTIWHLSGRSGWDLSIEDNILWNIVHGGRFFHAAPALGPTGSHFRRHAALIAYLLAPFYALHQSSEMVLILQSALQGLAAIPLFLFARRRLGETTAAIIALVYLLHPALQESNLFEAHYVKFGPLPFFTTLWLLDSRRTRAAIIAACLTVAVREDVATWVVLLGLWGIFADRSRRVSIFITALSCVYVALVKFVIMPALAGGQDELAFMYRELIPQGKESFAWAMVTVVTNPAYFIRSLLEMDKLVYFLQIMVPLALIPLTRKIGWFALIPGTVYSLMETQYHALVDIHYQYSPHFLAFVFPTLVFALESRGEGTRLSSKRVGALGAIVLGTLLCAYQYGPMFQQNNSRGGPIPYKFGWDDEGRARHRAIVELKQILPERAKVAASAFTVTQISSRPDGYSLSMSLYDADWIMAPTVRSEFLSSEKTHTVEALSSGTFGVVAVRPPFFIAKRGYPTHKNASLLASIGP
jgi:uncharacterized membrane protein